MLIKARSTTNVSFEAYPSYPRVIEDNDINHEPDLWKISAEHPIPQGLSKGSMDYMVLSAVNRCVEEGGPKAKLMFVETDYALLSARPSVASGGAAATAVSRDPQGGAENMTSAPSEARGGIVPTINSSLNSNFALEGMGNNRSGPLLPQLLLSGHQNTRIS